MTASSETDPVRTATGGWQLANDEYLAASLNWLRLVLAQQASAALVASRSTGSHAGSAPDRPAKRHWWSRRPRQPADDPPQGPTVRRLALTQTTGVTPEEVGAAAAARERAAESSPPPALLVLAEQLGLSDFERDVVLLCAAMELDPGMAARCAHASGDPGQPFPTFALAMRVLPSATWDARSPQHGLRYWQLVEVIQQTGTPLTASVLRADERIVNYLKGLNELDARLDALVTVGNPRGAGAAGLPPSLTTIVDEVARAISDAGPAPVVQLLGSDGRTKLDVASELAASLGCVLVRLPVELLPANPDELDLLARLWQREALLLPIVAYVDAQESTSDVDARALSRFLGRSGGPIVLATREPRTGLDRPTVPVPVSRPLASEQRDAWARLLGPGWPPRAAAGLSAQFDLAPSAIVEIAGRVAAESPIGADLDSYHRLWDACVAATTARLDGLAQRIEPRATWDDLVLPAEELALLRQVCDQVDQRTRVYDEWGFGDRMSRGLGISVLFAGSSGTGKTMAAEVLARHLRLSLFRIDLSAVVSKYIGETEKNLRQVFDAAEAGSAVLFFDEADALFGKRSEVKDAHDRYANIETNYLLQRMESYSGLAVLATNMRGSLDQAFMRRLRFIVTFPFPDAQQRRELWEGAFPAKAGRLDLDFDRLARMPATGAMVQNIALNAAFLAASARTSVTMDTVLASAATEFAKLELPMPDVGLPVPQPTYVAGVGS